MALLRASLAALLVLLGGCLAGPQPEPPTYRPDAGAGLPGDDGGAVLVDAGPAAYDAGSPTADAGVDAGGPVLVPPKPVDVHLPPFPRGRAPVPEIHLDAGVVDADEVDAGGAGD